MKKIKYGDKTIDMPDTMSLEQAKEQMARFFPELSEPAVETKKDGDNVTYVFSKKAGRKGGDLVHRIDPFEVKTLCGAPGQWLAVNFAAGVTCLECQRLQAKATPEPEA